MMVMPALLAYSLLCYSFLSYCVSKADSTKEIVKFLGEILKQIRETSSQSSC
jgi:hypothetical protein